MHLRVPARSRPELDLSDLSDLNMGVAQGCPGAVEIAPAGAR
jgi:hypothetical protein